MPEERVDDFSTVDQAMGNPPKWIVYWGISVIFIFLIVLLGIAAIIQYPDQIKASATIYLDRPPLEVFPKASTLEVQEILVEDNAQIKKGDLLIVYKSDADWKTVLALKDNLGTTFDVDAKTQLGELSPLYQQFIKAKELLNQEIRTDISAQKVLQLKTESSQIKALNQSLAEQIELYKHELDNVQKEYDRAVSLQASGVISLEGLEQKENKLLQQKRSLSQLEAQVINNRISLSRLDKSILELNANTSNAFFKLEQELEQQQKALFTAIETWEKQYLVRASIDGRIVLPFSTQPGSMPNGGSPILTILPRTSSMYAIAEAKIKANGLGKLMKEQTAQIYFEHYPAAEYGILKAKVASISAIPQEENYLVQLELPEKWVTDYGLEIPRQQSMPVEVAIQTQSYSLLRRIFSGLIDAIKH